MKEDLHFKKISDEYNTLDKEIRTLEQNNSPVEDVTLAEMKKKRSHLKDEAYQILTK